MTNDNYARSFGSGLGQEQYAAQLDDDETPRSDSVTHRMTLGYTIWDDGVHLSCACGYDVTLGFDATTSDALDAERTHRAAPDETQRGTDDPLTAESYPA